MRSLLNLPAILRSLAALWVAVMAGFFFAFSAVVMPGLATADQGVAMAAMQSINDSVRNFAFAAGFFGAPLLCVVAMVHAALRRDSVAAWMVLVGGAVYLIGGAGVTFLFNVPLNEDLATLDPSLPENHAQMVEWIREWSAWNNVRTIASAVASIFLVGSLITRYYTHQPTHD